MTSEAIPNDIPTDLPHSPKRRYPIGAEIIDGAVSFRVWAPDRARLELVINDRDVHEMIREEEGYFSVLVEGIESGSQYLIRANGQPQLLADPASRFQPLGPSGPSTVIDPDLFIWGDENWRGPDLKNLVLYELHIGTFTKEGTFAAAKGKLAWLKSIGITAVELMPVNEFEGLFGWGYDGTLLYAPTRLYGTPDDLRTFVNTAHDLGISVILDVVYNHFGHGNRFSDFAADYFTDRYVNEWGKSLNFDGPNSHGVRAYIATNAAYWIAEFHLDGLRIDATQALFDGSPDHIVSEIARRARAAAGNRHIVLISENEPQESSMVRSEDEGGQGLDALWNDDFHHSAVVALTGRHEAYYHDYRGTPQEFISAAKYGYLFQGQRYDWQDHPRGMPALDLRAVNFVHFLENHDQIANSGRGERLAQIVAPARLRAMTALLLLGPQIPMLFQGQEFWTSVPFCYFADREGDTADSVRDGRVDFMGQFPNLADEALINALPDPCNPTTFEKAKLDWAECKKNGHAVRLHRDLLALRRTQEAFTPRIRVDGGVISKSAFLLRFFASLAENERLLLVNLGEDLAVDSLPDPLFAPPSQMQWDLAWSSEDPSYGGSGRRRYDFRKRWVLGADTALLLSPTRQPPGLNPTARALQDWQNRIARR